MTPVVLAHLLSVRTTLYPTCCCCTLWGSLRELSPYFLFRPRNVDRSWRVDVMFFSSALHRYKLANLQYTIHNRLNRASFCFEIYTSSFPGCFV
ncbi:hypothetical protein F4811DRAFT_43923 [Daldinia bambusicola]|nr:hypothetical protein F4811DRAFT_43923 [Daldinia bambusicola]